MSDLLSGDPEHSHTGTGQPLRATRAVNDGRGNAGCSTRPGTTNADRDVHTPQQRRFSGTWHVPSSLRGALLEARSLGVEGSEGAGLPGDTSSLNVVVPAGRAFRQRMGEYICVGAATLWNTMLFLKRTEINSQGVTNLSDSKEKEAS